MDVKHLNKTFGFEGRIEFVSHPSGLPFVSVRNRHAKALISLLGGQLLSYRRHADTQDLLFVSERSQFAEGAAIRGGIPVCWPWFGPDPDNRQRPNHGFARNQLWKVDETAACDSKTTVRLRLDAFGREFEAWRQPFMLMLDIQIGKTLKLTLSTRNTGKRPFAITQAFHSYFYVGDIAHVEVYGLDGSRYFDKLDRNREKRQNGNVRLNAAADRIYAGIDGEVTVRDASLQREIRLSAPDRPSVVVWNPWESGAAHLDDLAPDDYRRFICVETGNVAERIELPPGGEHRFETEISILA